MATYFARNVNGADRAEKKGKESANEREREKSVESYNEGIDMLIRDRGVAARVFRWCLIPLRVRTRALIHALTPALTDTHVHALTHSYAYICARINRGKRRIGQGARSRCVLRAYITHRVTYSMGVTRTKKGQDGKGSADSMGN